MQKSAGIEVRGYMDDVKALAAVNRLAVEDHNNYHTVSDNVPIWWKGGFHIWEN